MNALSLGEDVKHSIAIRWTDISTEENRDEE
jgi:hypothetical protein